ncbi:hypothetical protein JCM10207_006819 [Rhodosporidiobolus poonsookiae]
MPLVVQLARSRSCSSRGRRELVLSLSLAGAELLSASYATLDPSSIDWSALAEAATHSNPPSPLPLLDPTSTLAAHRQLAQQETHLDAHGTKRTSKVVLGVPPAAGAPDEGQLDDLEVVDLSGDSLRCDDPAYGKLLPVRILTLPLRTSSVQFVVEDTHGRVAPVQLFGVPQRLDEGKEGLEAWFPVGAVFGINHPHARSTRTGYALRTSPALFTRLYPSSPVIASLPMPFPPSRHCLPHPLDALSNDPARLLEAGKRAAGEERWVGAKEALEWALAALGASEDVDDKKKLRVEALSLLAEANLALGLPHSAKRNCVEALALLSADKAGASAGQEQRDALRIRLAAAQCALEAYAAALETLALVAAGSPWHEQAAALKEQATLRRHEQKHGPSPSTLRGLFLSAQAATISPSPPSTSAPFPLPASYVSPFLSLSALPTKGLGVLALSAIPRGELLMLSRPLAACPSPPLGRVAHTVGLNTATRTMDPPAVGGVAAEMGWRVAVERAGAGEEDEVGEMEREVRALWAGEQLRRVDDPTKGAMSADEERARVEGAVTFNGFVVEDLASAREPGAPPPSSPSPSSSSAAQEQERDEEESAFTAPLALYPLRIGPGPGPGPSALNHSCVPNCSYTFLSPPFSPSSSATAYAPLFLLRARRPIAPGEELTIEYVSAAYSSLAEREAKCAGHGFRCACLLCAEERAAGPAKRERRERGEARAWELADEARRVRDSGRAEERWVRRMLAEAERVRADIASTYAPSSPLPRPALYAPNRLLSLLRSLDSPLRALDTALEAELAALSALGGVIDGMEWIHPPACRDTDATLSVLECARVCWVMGDESLCRYFHLARSLEAGQAGAELFDLRFGGWVGRKGLPGRLLDEVVWREEAKE